MTRHTQKIPYLFIAFALASSTLCVQPSLADQVSYGNETRRIENMTRDKYNAYLRFTLAEQEAVEGGSEQDAELYRIEKKKLLDEYIELKHKLLEFKSNHWKHPDIEKEYK